jgi:hypothetical protein
LGERSGRDGDGENRYDFFMARLLDVLSAESCQKSGRPNTARVFISCFTE